MLVGLALLLVPAVWSIHSLGGNPLTRPDGIVAAAKTAVGIHPTTYHLHWEENPDAVWYSAEFHDAAGRMVERVPKVYSNDMIVPHTVSGEDTMRHLTYSVQAFDFDGNAISLPSIPAPVLPDSEEVTDAPWPRSVYNEGNGTTLLYPVYAYTSYPGAALYEVELLTHKPENPNGWEPSHFRVASFVSYLTDQYDDRARIGEYYWRVRALRADGRPISCWSDARTFRTSPRDNWTVAVFGDSIGHGGGHLSYCPTDWDYSFLSYLSFPAINLSQSGDTSEMMKDRFKRDVLPFHPQVVLIMGGSNSLRESIPAENVIEDLQAMADMAREHGIRPILLTLPPINPEQIEKTFKEPTYEDWRKSFNEVNEYIRTQPHIDTAAAFDETKDLPAEYALDGLHGDWRAKKMMAQVINEDIGRILDEEDAEMP